MAHQERMQEHRVPSWPGQQRMRTGRAMLDPLYQYSREELRSSMIPALRIQRQEDSMPVQITE